jgi:SAM-dependent methyltransferase
MREWAQKHLPPSPTPIRVLESGCGNGTLLLSFLTSPRPAAPQPFHLTGIDYSAGAISLARGVEMARRAGLDWEDRVVNEVEVEWRQGDLLRDNIEDKWDLVLDKGTFDALALSNEVVDGNGRLPSIVYPERIARLVREGGFFLITSCNFTEEEIRRRYTRPELGKLPDDR